MTDRWPTFARLAALAIAGAGLALGACDILPYTAPYTPGGPQVSYDCATYESTPDTPWTVSVVDLTTGETIWTCDVPIGKKLVVRFYEDENPSNQVRPSVLRWKFMAKDQYSGTLDNAIAVPPKYARRLDTSLRTEGQARPEPVMAPSVAPAAVATTPPPPLPPPPPPAPKPAEPTPNK